MSGDLESISEATSGAIGALVSTTILYPLDTCKAKYQAEVQAHGLRKYRFLFLPTTLLLFSLIMWSGLFCFALWSVFLVVLCKWVFVCFWLDDAFSWILLLFCGEKVKRNMNFLWRGPLICDRSLDL